MPPTNFCRVTWSPFVKVDPAGMPATSIAPGSLELPVPAQVATAKVHVTTEFLGLLPQSDWQAGCYDKAGHFNSTFSVIPFAFLFSIMPITLLFSKANEQ